MVAIMEGIRVLEVAVWTFVPMAGGVLADWGADVLKIEHPETGDPQRGLISSGLIPGGTVNFAIEVPNRGKRSVALDLTTDEGHQALLDLAATSDVFLTSMLPESRTKLRVDLDDIRAVNPNIIYVRGSANGTFGPEANRGGYDGCTFWARGGAADICTPAMNPYPVPPPGGAFGDVLGGLTIAGGISAALLHRERTGEALVVDCSLLAMGAWATSFSLAAAAAFGLERMPMGVREGNGNPLVNVYKTGDGRFLSLVMMQSDKFWPELMTVVGRPELIDDPRFVDAAARAANKEACYAELDAIFASRTLAEWKVAMKDTEGVWAVVQTPKEVLEDPQLEANGLIRDVVGPDGNTFRLVAPPVIFGETSPELRRGPELGEHTDEVLADVGYDAERLIDLKIKGRDPLIGLRQVRVVRVVGLGILAVVLLGCADDPNPPERVLPPDATVESEATVPTTAVTVTEGPGPTLPTPTQPPPPIVESSFVTLDELAVRLGCSRFALAELDSETTGSARENRSAAATCTLAGDSVALALFADTDHRDAWIAQGREFGCDAARDLGISSFFFAVGANWAVEPADVEDEAAAANLAATLGGTPRTITC